jgi:serine/threonine protein kinase
MAGLGLPRAVGRYQVDARLGGGGMAEVFRGHVVGAEGFSRPVALKRVLAGLAANPAFSDMFIKEAQISSQLRHPNVVAVQDFDRDEEGGLFLVMELVEGKDLAQLLASGPLPIGVTLYIVTEILRGLGYAHDLSVSAGADTISMKGVIHRDVSPHNVLLSWAGEVKVSDFGIAKAREHSAASASLSIKGKPAYMSPEQATGEPLDGRSDLFAVGITLWEMLTGERLFVGTTQEVIAQVLYRDIPPPSSVRPVPAEVDAIVMRLLTRPRAQRYLRSEDALADLLQCAQLPRDGRGALTALLCSRYADAPRTRAESNAGGAAADDPLQRLVATVEAHRPPGAVAERFSTRTAGPPAEGRSRKGVSLRTGLALGALTAASVLAGVVVRRSYFSRNGVEHEARPSQDNASPPGPASVVVPSVPLNVPAPAMPPPPDAGLAGAIETHAPTATPRKSAPASADGQHGRIIELDLGGSR